MGCSGMVRMTVGEKHHSSLRPLGFAHYSPYVVLHVRAWIDDRDDIRADEVCARSIQGERTTIAGVDAPRFHFFYRLG